VWSHFLRSFIHDKFSYTIFTIQKNPFSYTKKGGRGREVAYRKSKKHIFQNHLAPKIGGNHLKSSQDNTHQKAKRGQKKNWKLMINVFVNVCMFRWWSWCCVLIQVLCFAPGVACHAMLQVLTKKEDEHCNQGFLGNIIYYEFAKRCRTVQISIVLFCTVYCTTWGWSSIAWGSCCRQT